MNLEELVLAGANILFGVAVIPTILSKTEKPTFFTCAMTALLLWACVIAYLGLHLLIGVFGITFDALAWTFLWWQVQWAKKKR